MTDVHMATALSVAFEGLVGRLATQAGTVTLRTLVASAGGGGAMRDAANQTWTQEGADLVFPADIGNQAAPRTQQSDGLQSGTRARTAVISARAASMTAQALADLLSLHRRDATTIAQREMKIVLVDGERAEVTNVAVDPHSQTVRMDFVVRSAVP